jgi:hypothetical protein
MDMMNCDEDSIRNWRGILIQFDERRLDFGLEDLADLIVHPHALRLD